MPAPASRLLQQADVRDFHASIKRLAHIVERERRHRRGRQRFHFDPCWTGCGHPRGDLYPILTQLGVNIYVRQQQRVTKRNQLRCAFRRGNARDSRDFERITLGSLHPTDFRQRHFANSQEALGYGCAFSSGLVRDVDHSNLSAGIVMSKPASHIADGALLR